jgi:hypothetical protein
VWPVGKLLLLSPLLLLRSSSFVRVFKCLEMRLRSAARYSRVAVAAAARTLLFVSLIWEAALSSFGSTLPILLSRARARLSPSRVAVAAAALGRSLSL